ncbi:hypothetical protein NP493_22g03019 [Ridgeia piscesae]|nr:hypothetical protein NP493_22g03019 [Ridgeia piscesae]
MSHLYRS